MKTHGHGARGSRLSGSRFVLLIAVVTFCCQAETPEESPSPDATPQFHNVIPVQGSSWLEHLGVTSDQTSMGRLGGETPIPETSRKEPDLVPDGLGSVLRRYLSRWPTDRGAASRALNESFVLAGADLYRLSCRSCHGPDGEGAPPEIGSLLDPVRATSVALTQERMKDRGTPIAEDMARELASEAQATLRSRIQDGGDKMPPFDHLRGEEVEALFGYLETLAGVPSGERQELLVSESAARVGEHVVKGTCHICHDATGPGGGHMAMMRGIIPSLASLPRDHALSAVVRQVEYGSSSMMAMMRAESMMKLETMSAMPYFTEEEIAAGYFYLAEYSPLP